MVSVTRLEKNSCDGVRIDRRNRGKSCRRTVCNYKLCDENEKKNSPFEGKNFKKSTNTFILHENYKVHVRFDTSNCSVDKNWILRVTKSRWTMRYYFLVNDIFWPYKPKLMMIFSIFRVLYSLISLHDMRLTLNHKSDCEDR